jgi:DNA-binding NtrC family response regulator
VQLQAKLLHVLQDGEFSRLGSRSSIKVDVRILAATNIDVQAHITNKTFREDLYYRLNAFTVNIPPLRERREEIPVLLRHMMNRMAESYGRPPIEFSPELLRACMEAPWAGNVRELNNFVKRFLILGDEALALEELRASQPEPAPSRSAPLDLKQMVRDVKDVAEMEAITKALTQCGWNRKRAAVKLKISYKALLYKVKQYKIQPPSSVGVGFVDKELN